MSPHLLSAATVLPHLVLAAAKAKTTTSSSGTSTIIFILFIFVIAYFLLIRPQRTRAKRQQQSQQQIQIGDEVMLTSGIIGRVTWLEGDRARLEIAPGTEIEVVRNALGRRITPPVSDADIGVHEEEGESHESAELPFAVPGGASSEHEEPSGEEGTSSEGPVAEGEDTSGG